MVAAWLFCNGEERENEKKKKPTSGFGAQNFRQLPFFIRACGVVLEPTDLVVFESKEAENETHKSTLRRNT